MNDEFDCLPPPDWYLLEHDGELRRAVVAQPTRWGLSIAVMYNRSDDGHRWVFSQDAGVALSYDDGLKSLLCMLVNLARPAVTATDYSDYPEVHPPPDPEAP